MQVIVNIPTLLRPLANGQKSVNVSAADVLGVIDQIERQYPGVKERLLAGDQVHRFINIYVNDDDIRFSDGLATRLNEGDSVTILPAVAGGRC